MKRGAHPYPRTAALLRAQPMSTAQLRRRRRKTRLSLAIAGTLIMGVLLWLALDNRWYVLTDDVHVTGVSSEAMRMRVIRASDLLGWHSLWVRPQAAGARILAHLPDIARAEVTCTRFPATCTIAVVEREPAVIWQANGRTYWVDAEGVVFPAREDAPIEGAELPLVQGPLPLAEAEGGELPHLAPQVLDGLVALVSLGLPTKGLHYHPDRGWTWYDAEGRRVAFGVGADMAPRWHIYRQLIEHLEAKGIFPWTIDVRFPRGPTYALERTW